jgi:hypothetical protein
VKSQPREPSAADQKRDALLKVFRAYLHLVITAHQTGQAKQLKAMPGPHLMTYCRELAELAASAQAELATLNDPLGATGSTASFPTMPALGCGRQPFAFRKACPCHKTLISPNAAKTELWVGPEVNFYQSPLPASRIWGMETARHMC